MRPPRTTTIATPRLLLRPSEADDAPRAFEVQSSWEVTRVLRQTSWPPDRELAELVAGHAEENAASGRILRRLGFRHLRDVQVHSRSRGAPVVQRQYALRRPGA